jgi:hypothetical protein
MASVSNDGDNDEKVTNPYLAMREAKIARNQQRLSELGLLKPQPPPKQRPIPKKPQQRNIQVRRSSRLSSQESQPGEKEGASLTSSVGKRTRDTPESALSYSLSANQSKKTKEPPPAFALAPDPASVRSISLDVNYLLLGHDEDHRDGLLGKMGERPGKDYVIHKSFTKAAYSDDRDRLSGKSSKLSFNKYSGVQEWKVR